jgi:thymidylate kinase
MDSTFYLTLVRQLCNELVSNNICYCHWKSNVLLDRSASGENDLDLLISQADTKRFTEILDRLDFRQAVEMPSRRIQGIDDYYGQDGETGRWVHVHAHYQLVLGHDATKNYRIPLEEAYLAASARKNIFRVPDPEFELILLVIRLMLKHFTWDAMLLGQGRLSYAELNELDFLLRQASLSKVDQILELHLPYLETTLFRLCINTLRGNSSLWSQLRTGQKFLNSIAAFARRPRWIDVGLKFWRRVAWPLNEHILGRMDRRFLNSGGKVVAIAGGDGAGKTSAVDAVFRWLSQEFQVCRYHMGKPNWSLLTILIRGILKIGRTLGIYPFIRAEIGYTKESNLLEFPGYPWMIREVCTARDRYIVFKRARRRATKGEMVILDRFPLPQITFMDGPQIDRMTVNGPNNRFTMCLSRIEKWYYRKMMPPEIMIVLRVDPEIAVGRKFDESEESVRARSTEVWEIDWSRSAVDLINAGRSKEEVWSEIKRTIWSRL